MSDEIEPALTEKEWEEKGFTDDALPGPPDVHAKGEEIRIEAFVPPGERRVKRRHALAALCLHGQPFGFTWEDVDELREAAKNLPYLQGLDDKGGDDLLDLADRLAALLPPRNR